LRAPAGRRDCHLGAGRPQADYALVWAPPQQFLDEQPGPQGHVQHRRRRGCAAAAAPPPDLPVYRLEDAGMAVQMAEYVARP
jgi:glyoxylate/hydroxypyruvate reductase A